MIVFGIAMAILNSALVGLGGILPPKYMSAFMLGLSLNAVGPIILRVITLLSFGLMDQVKYFYGALVFFGICSAYMFVCSFGVKFVIK